MTLRIHAPNPIRVGETANVLVTSDNPGVVSLTYGAGLTGPATAEIEGTRAWHPNPACGYQWGWNGSDALAALTEARDGVTICFDVDLGWQSQQPLSSQIFDNEIVAQSYKKSTLVYLHNWIISFRFTGALYSAPVFQYTQTNAPPTAGAVASVAMLNAAAFGKYLRCVLTLNGTALTLYYHDGTTKRTASATRTAPTGVVADPCLAIYGGARFAYFSSLLADDANGVDSWLAGNCPASAVVYYPCAEELETQAPWDYSGNDRDGQFSVDPTYPLTKVPRIYTDDPGNPVIPYAIVPVTAVATTDTTIDATRPRQGVPARASEAERIETADQCTVTVEVEAVAPPVPVPEIGPGDTLNLFPRWLHSEPHAIGLSAVLDLARGDWVDTLLPSLLIYDVDNQTSAILDLVAEAWGIYGWNKAAGDDEKIAFLRNSLKIQRKIGTVYAVKQAVRLVVLASKIDEMSGGVEIIEGTGGVMFDGEYDFDGSIDYDSHYHWARFDVKIYTMDTSYFTAEVLDNIRKIVEHYKPASRWLESVIIQGTI